MSEQIPPSFLADPDPEHPGWLEWRLSDPSLFNGQVMGKLLLRDDGNHRATLRMFPERRHTNLLGTIHGGVTLALVDIAMFAGSRLFGVIEAGTAVTLDLSTQFLGAGNITSPLDAEVEMLKETGRFVFLRGLVVQNGNRIAAYSGTIRKPSSK